MAFNDITGDALKTRVTTDKYRDNFDAIFRRKPVQSEQTESEAPEVDQQDTDTSSDA